MEKFSKEMVGAPVIESRQNNITNIDIHSIL